MERGLPDGVNGTLLCRHPRITAVVCTAGARPTLHNCLHSLLGQMCDRFEVILVWNNSGDMNLDGVPSHPRLRVLREERKGVSHARNLAVKQACGEILVFVDDDIVMDSRWLHELTAGFEDPQVVCITGRVIPDGPTFLSREKEERYYSEPVDLSVRTLDPNDSDSFQGILGAPLGYGCNMAFRKEFLQAYKTFPEDLGAGSLIGGGDDLFMFVQVLRHGFRIQHAPRAAVTHCFEADATKQKPRMAQLYSANVAVALKLLLEEKLVVQVLRWVSRALARRLRQLLARKTLTPEPQELLTFTEKLRAYLRGVSIYRQSRRLHRRRLSD